MATLIQPTYFSGISDLLAKFSECAVDEVHHDASTVEFAPRPGSQVVRQFSDLFAVARVLSAASSLLASRPGLEVVVDLTTAGTVGVRAFQRLQALEVVSPDWLPGFQFRLQVEQLRLFPETQQEDQLGTGGEYWRCIIPVTRLAFTPTTHEPDLMEVVREAIGNMSEAFEKTAGDLELDQREFGSELPRILYPIFGELLSNAVAHSGSNQCFYSLVLSRTPGLDLRWVALGMDDLQAKEKWDLVVFDLGKGIHPTIRNQVSGSRSDAGSASSSYWAFGPWSEEMRLLKKEESTLLDTIFRGDLLVRRGRRSEGLWEIGNALAWFGGALNVHSGRTEVAVTTPMGAPRAQERPKSPNQQVFLPGVIAGALLPSRQLRAAVVDRLFTSVGDPAHYDMLVRSELPAGLLEMPEKSPIRRRSERAAEELKIAVEDAGGATILLDLRLSDRIDVNFFDSVLQELGKDRGDDDDNALRRLVFINVPRSVIETLRRMNGASFLRMNKVFAVLLDEMDTPHFLGPTRYTQAGLDLEDVLLAALRLGEVSLREVEQKTSISPALLQILTKSLPTSLKSSCLAVRDGAVVARDILAGITRLREERVDELRHFVVDEGPGEAYQLSNGTPISSVIDFDAAWASDPHRRSIAKLLVSKTEWNSVDTLMAFMDNGATLASEIQRYSGTPELIILDPHRPEYWDDEAKGGHSVIVVDVLYPGDDHAGYIRQLIHHLSQDRHPSRRPRALVAGLDLRPDPGGSIEGVPVVACRPTDLRVGWPAKVGEGEDVTRFVSRGRYYQYTKYEMFGTDTNGSDYAAYKVAASSYSNVEFSTDFWQNVATLGVVAPVKQGREERNALFYENNERLIRHARLRRYVKAFITDFVARRIDRNADVILHPTHAVGATLASWAAAEMAQTPLIVPLPQPQYGGRIQARPMDIHRWKGQVRALRNKRGEKLRALILDDSVLSGQSLITMRGIAEVLGLEVSGTAVLLSRLSTEVTAALAGMGGSFAYLYRLHMPLLSEADHPDRRIASLSAELLRRTSSGHAAYWAEILNARGDPVVHLLATAPGADGGVRLGSNDPLAELLSDHDRSWTEWWTDRTRQALGEYASPANEFERWIIGELLLHKDATVLSFGARASIAYNFLTELADSEAFYRLLKGMLGLEDVQTASPSSRRFVMAVLYIIAFSNELTDPERYRRFEEFCGAVLDRAVHGEAEALRGILPDVVTVLGLIGSTRVGRWLANSLMEIVDGVSDSSFLSRALAGAISWSVDASAQLGAQDYRVIQPLYLRDLERLDARDASVVLDMAMSLVDTAAFRWEHSEDALADLDGSRAAWEYLLHAPGYTCTLRSVLTVCKADSVTLYSANDADDAYYVRALALRDRGGEEQQTQADSFNSKSFSPTVSALMESGLPAVLSDPHDRRALQHLTGADHQWGLALPVVLQDSPMKYYVLLGFRHRDLSWNQLVHIVHYWRRMEPLLKQILPSIHRTHIEASSTWNALIRSMATVHPIGELPRQNETTEDYSRRKAADEAVRYVSTRRADHLAQALEFYAMPLQDLRGTRREIRQRANDVLARLREDFEWPDTLALPAEYEDLLEGLEDSESLPNRRAIFAAPTGVLKFVFYECLKNALSHYHGVIGSSLLLDDIRSKGSQLEANLVFRMWNDRNSDRDVMPERGLAACRTAAHAVRGEFDWDVSDRSFRVELVLPAHLVPRELHGILPTRD